MSGDATIRMRSGREMPAIGLGTWQLTDATAATVEAALRLGYRMIDTSADYGTQPSVGEGMRRSDLPRDELFLVAKVEEDEDAYEAVRRNLGELGLDYADLFVVHRPPARGAGVELWEGLLRAREEGLARDAGVSNYSIEQLEELADATGEIPAVNQIEWSPFGWSAEMHAYCRDRGIVIQAYSPLTRRKRVADERLAALAAGYGKTTAQLLLRWCIELRTAPIPKASSREHLEENLDVFDFEIRPEHMRELGSLNEHYSSLGSLQYV